MTRAAKCLRCGDKLEEFRRGVKAAAAFAGDWDKQINHPYRFEDVILCKFNIRKRKPRKKPAKRAAREWNMAKIQVQMIDKVWAEEPGVEVRAVYQEGAVLLEIIKDGAVVSSATLGLWRWGRLHKIEVDDGN